MTQSISIMPDSNLTETEKPLILERLPEITGIKQNCSTHVAQQIDLLLLAIEALELGGSENMLNMAKDLELKKIIKNRVTLWQLRCTNPWRGSYNRDFLTLEQAKALVIIIANMSKRLTVLIRQLILAEQTMRGKDFPLDNHFRLSEYLDQFRAHFSNRMNKRRAKVEFYLASEDDLNELAMSLLNKLLFCTGTKGMERLWVSLFDGEVG